MKNILVFLLLIFLPVSAISKNFGPHDVSLAARVGPHDPALAKQIGPVGVDFSETGEPEEICQAWTFNTAYTTIDAIARYNGQQYSGVIIDISGAPKVCSVSLVIGNTQSGISAYDYYFEVIPLDSSYNFVADFTDHIIDRSEKVDGTTVWSYTSVTFTFATPVAASYSGSDYAAVAIKAIADGADASTRGGYNSTVFCAYRYDNDAGVAATGTVGRGRWSASGTLTDSDTDDNLVISISTMQEK